MTIAAIVLGVALLLVVPALLDATFRPNLRRLAWRNLWRRKSEAVLVTLGTLLGTSIIVASFVVGDTIEDAVLSLVYTSEGPLDEAVVIEDPTQLDALTFAIEQANISDIDGILPILSMPTVLTTTSEDPLAEPRLWFAEVDFDLARQFGGDPEATGFAEAGPGPGPGEIVLLDHAAVPLGIEIGDTVTIHAYGVETNFLVTNIIPRAGTAGWNSGYVAPGTIFDMYDPTVAANARPPRAEVAISNTGDIFTGAELTEAVTEELEAATAHLDQVTVEDIKASTLEDAEGSGAEFTTLFSGIGSFAVIAGILLIVNLFVMLSEERKNQLGILRAIGFRRNQVTRAFGIEGALYAVAATVLGTVAGVGVGWVLVQAIKRVFFDVGDFLTIDFAVTIESLLLSAGIGLGLAMITIWGTAIRIVRFNVIAAIRDLPNPPGKQHNIRRAVLGSLGVAAGVAITYLGFAEESEIAILAGPGIMAFAAIAIVRFFLPISVAASLMGSAAIAWGVLAFTILPDQMENSSIAVFVVQGLILVAGAVIVSSSAQRLWRAAVDALASAGMGLSTRLGLAYPMARRVRTGLLLAMFSLVIFMVSFLSVFSGIFTEQTKAFADESRAGNDILVQSSDVNPVSTEQIVDVDGVASATAFLQAFPEFETEGDETDTWRVSGFDESLLALGTPVLSQRSSEYVTDEEAYRAVLADPDLIIVDDFFLQSGGAPDGDATYRVGDVVTMINEVTGESRDLEIVGVMASDFLFAGSYMGADHLSESMGPLARVGRFFVAAEAGTDPGLLASRLNAELIGFGVDAGTFDDEVTEEAGETLGIFRMFQGFLSLGLLIGVAGLAVVLIRAVRERRRSIGVLRALGYSEQTVRRAFLIEAAFIAVQGVTMGAGLGVLTAYQVLVNSNTFGETEFAFSWPWVALVVILIAPTLASLAAAAMPAVRASRISPAVALRIE